MSFDNSYPRRKDQRKGYYKSKAFDKSCRPGGSCPWCSKGRKHRSKRQQPLIEKETDQ